MRIDINSDMGESFGAYSIGHDVGLMASITSANIAAGFHAGDPSVLRETIRLAKARGVAIGAHPGYPDLVGAVAAFDSSLILFGLPGSEILNAGRAARLRVAAEVFADRAYEPDGLLASRRKPGAVIHDPDVVVARAVRMVKERSVVAIDGSVVPLEADTICVHGDTPGSDDLAARIRAGLEAAGIVVRPIGS